MQRTRLTTAFLALTSVAWLGCDGPDTTAPVQDQPDPLSAVAPSAGMAATDGSALATLRRATAKYHRVEVAEADGYFAPDECVEVPGLGGMGIHYVHLGNINDGVADPSAPDVLLYEPQKNGRLRLVGAEFVIWRADWGDPPGPTFLGQDFAHSFGEHAHGLPDHYEMHIWIWRHNPSGMLAPFNPMVSCS